MLGEECTSTLTAPRMLWGPAYFICGAPSCRGHEELYTCRAHIAVLWNKPQHNNGLWVVKAWPQITYGRARIIG